MTTSHPLTLDRQRPHANIRERNYSGHLLVSLLVNRCYGLDYPASGQLKRKQWRASHLGHLTYGYP